MRIAHKLDNFLLDFMGDFEIVVLFFELIDVVHLDVRIGKQSSAHGLVAGIGYREEYATKVNNITWAHLTRQTSMDMNGHGAWDMSDRDLIGLISRLANLQ